MNNMTKVGFLEVQPGGEIVNPDDYDWLTARLKNRRVTVGKHKRKYYYSIFFKRLGESAGESKVVYSQFGLSGEAGAALHELLYIHETPNAGLIAPDKSEPVVVRQPITRQQDLFDSPWKLVKDELPNEGEIVIIQTLRGNIGDAKIVEDRWETNKFHNHISDVVRWMEVPA